jgi:hypothetical protein
MSREYWQVIEDKKQESLRYYWCFVLSAEEFRILLWIDTIGSASIRQVFNGYKGKRRFGLPLAQVEAAFSKLMGYGLLMANSIDGKRTRTKELTQEWWLDDEAVAFRRARFVAPLTPPRFK